jgi:hypothetical protein
MQLEHEQGLNMRTYKKMAGTAAVFIPADFPMASPVERDSMIWTDAELSMPESPLPLHWKAAMESSLALEGLEEYEPPSNGDVRYVKNLGIAFVYIGKIRGWVAITTVV